MDIFLQLTTAGTDTGPTFELYSDVNSYAAPPFDTVSKDDLLAGYYTTAPAGTTTVRIRSVAPSLCSSFVDIVLEPLPPVDDCQCYLISSIQDPLLPLLGTTFFYTDCNDNFLSVYLDPNQVNYVCSKIVPTYFPEDRGLVSLEPNSTNCGGCPPSSTTTTTTTTCPTYYELAGCDPGDYAFTTEVPTLGAGQQYVLPLFPDPKFYTYTGFSIASCVVPGPYNASIQATNEIDCPS